MKKIVLIIICILMIFTLAVYGEGLEDVSEKKRNPGVESTRTNR